ncbi:CDP-diacylglycerol--glycerol-3-phosphate 3-phosphatidyltransferase [Salinibacter altiplanensis]|uniref:CDP-diacylglycerol--glycerol-3-phosphate 3-phosphatidyltransferase n=1 Tax=Salinibacter altiplanensis TaxID=1803181 RepID=UPI000C9EE1BF|nr:CDP-diacylglycerol--glycerol-3-phosphate 3-phosphatidyltransferase [Salinibacter altiplanensis]
MYTSTALRYIPNLLTVGRILVTPLLLLFLSIPSKAGQMSAVVLFVLASLTDYYDGVLARRLGVRSRLGQYLDPLADKVLILGTFIALALEAPDLVPWWAVVAIALRDLVVTGVRSWVEASGETLHTYRVAKGKTMLQAAFLFGVLTLRAATHFAPPLREAARWVLYDSGAPGLALTVVVGFTLATGALYVVAPVEEKVDLE